MENKNKTIKIKIKMKMKTLHHLHLANFYKKINDKSKIILSL
ncbi:hypothetical protein J500_2091 [Acinetobacter sp. 479375]|nr:hypothetical protein J500_2091 [Acinetobacter sp. 479375]